MDTSSQRIATVIRQARKHLLNVTEAAFGHQPQFPFVRSRILKIFGRDGLEQLCLLEDGTVKPGDLKDLAFGED